MGCWRDPGRGGACGGGGGRGKWKWKYPKMPQGRGWERPLSLSLLSSSQGLQCPGSGMPREVPALLLKGPCSQPTSCFP
jgi:hypothetical protein